MIPTLDECERLYAKVAQLNLRTDLQGWHAGEPIFEDLVKRLAPGPITYIEVGSWKGASMVRVNHLAKFLNIPIKNYAVDFWSEQPGLYEQFLHNMRALSIDRDVVPIQGHSFDAALALSAEGIAANLIYLDADHTRNGCLADMVAYYPLLAPRGIMFGDDYTEERGVKEAVMSFCMAHRIRPEVTTYYHWQLPPKP